MPSHIVSRRTTQYSGNGTRVPVHGTASLAVCDGSTVPQSPSFVQVRVCHVIGAVSRRRPSD